MELKLAGTTSKAKDVFNYEIMLDGDAIGICQIRQTPSKSAGMPEGFENNVTFGLYPGYDDRLVLDRLFVAMRQEAQKIGITELIGILAVDETASALTLELLGAQISDAAQTSDGNLVRKFVLAQVQHHEEGKPHERRASI